MNWKEKIDSFWKGLLIGILFPLVVFFCYWLFFYSYMNFPNAFIRYLKHGDMLSNAIKICAIGNLLLFYLFLNAKIDKATKGIITSVILYLGLVVYVMVVIEKGSLF
jgi:hypothetical protein